MNPVITIAINLDRMDKARLFKKKTGQFIYAVLIPVENDEFGNDYRIVQHRSLEERARGVKTPIIGNGKVAKAEEHKA